ncbi:DMT family transporter [Vogesella oryzae]|uniref:DMT family transporter n=1 Tax=Vogesella oryzae TaxID=1735285 RepID=UPI001582B218|nr:DMT family transporter [Vogesella oryzae]
MDFVKQKLLAVSCAITTALVWGLMWYPFRHLHGTGFSTAATSLSVYIVATIIGVTIYRDVFRREARFEPILLLLAFLYGWCNFAYTWAVAEGEVMRVLLLFYLSPLWSALFSRLLLHERLSRIGWLVVVMSLTGLVVILYRPGLFSGQIFSSRADWLALSGGISFALGNVLSKKAHGLPVALKSAMVWLGVAGCGLVSLLWRGQLVGEMAQLAQPDVALIVLALGVTLLATSIISLHGLSILPATQVMTLMLLELVFAAISAYFLAGEAMKPQEWLGGLLIASASLMSGRIIAKPNAAP